MKRRDIWKQIRFLSLLEEREVSDKELDALIDEGYHVAEGRRTWPWAVVPKPAYINTTVGAERYVIPSFSHIISIIGTADGVQLRSVSLQELAMNAWEKHGSPELFAVESDKIVLSPIPNESCQNFDVIYTRAKSWRLADDVPPFDPQFHSILVDWALHRIWEREEDFDRSDRYRSRFESRLADMERFYNTRAQDRPLIYGVDVRQLRRPLHNAENSLNIREMT